MLAPFVQDAFGWRIYKRVGGNVEEQGEFSVNSVLALLTVSARTLALLDISHFVRSCRCASCYSDVWDSAGVFLAGQDGPAVWRLAHHSRQLLSLRRIFRVRTPFIKQCIPSIVADALHPECYMAHSKLPMQLTDSLISQADCEHCRDRLHLRLGARGKLRCEQLACLRCGQERCNWTSAESA